MKSSHALAATALLCLTAVIPLVAKPFAVTDLAKIVDVHSAAVSPSGDWLVYGLNRSNTGSNLYLKDLNNVSNEPLQLTSHANTERNVVWSADSTSIYFIANRQGLAQVWRLNLAGGEALPVTDFAVSVLGFKLSPDNQKMALLLPAAEQEMARKQAKTSHLTTAVVIRDNSQHMQVTQDLFVAQLNDNKLSTLVKLAGTGTEQHHRLLALADISFSQDGKSVVYSAKATDTSADNYDLWQVALSDVATANTNDHRAKNLTTKNQGKDYRPIFSTDGRFMAYLAQGYLNGSTRRESIVLVDLVTNKTKELAPLWDRSPVSIKFAPDSRNIYVTANDLGQRAVFVVNIQFGDLKQLYGNGSSEIIGVSYDQLVISNNDLAHPDELYLLSRQGGKLTPITKVNQALVENSEFAEFSQFSFKGWNDEQVQGYWLKPTNYRQGTISDGIVAKSRSQ